MKKVSKEERERLAYELKKFIKPGCVVYGIIRSQGNSGNSTVSPVIIAGNDLLHPAYGISVLTGYRLVEKNGYNALYMKGYGYNKIDAIAEAIAYALYGPGNHKITGRYI